MYSVNIQVIKHVLVGFVFVLMNLVAGSGQASAATAYACIRVVRADPGFPTAPTITLPTGYSQVTSTGYAVSSEGEYYVFVQGPDGTALGATVSWPGVPFTDIIMNDTHLTLRTVATNRDAATCDIPVHATSLRNAWPTFEIHSFFNESDLALRVEHNLTYRRAGWYADHPWVSGQARAVVNYIFASRLIMRDWGIQHRVATAKAGNMSLLGFESNDPVHIDYPPHLHIIMYLPTAGNAGTKIPHFYMDDHGLITSNKIQVLSHPELGDQYLYANQPMTYVDTAGTVWMAATIRTDGGLDLGPDATTVAYSMIPDDPASGSTQAVRVLRAGQLFARVSTNDDTIAGTLTVQTDFYDGVTPSQSMTSYFDPLTGVPLTSPITLRSSPIITSADGAGGTAGSPLSYAITATRSPSSYTADGLPAGLAIDASSGVISGSPTTAGVYRVMLTATNADGSGSAPLTLSIDQDGGNGTPTGGTQSVSSPPVVQPAAANPSQVAGTSTSLSVQATDDGGEPALTYTWSSTGPVPVTFSVNGTNAAKVTTAGFQKAGAYEFTVLVRDAGGSTASSSVHVDVSQTVTSLVVTPSVVQVAQQASQQFTASAKDQFGNAMTTTPTVSWSLSGGGTFTSSGLFTAGSVDGQFAVTASAGAVSGSAQVTVGSAQGFTTKINFQPATAPSVSGYLVDSGGVYGVRNDLSYGWNAAVDTRDRNVNADQRVDTLALMQAAKNPTAQWELAVPNGLYQVHVVCGDPSYFDGSFALDVEGVRAVTGRATAAVPFVEGTVRLQVADGRLTLTNGGGSYNTKICYIEVMQVPTGNG